MSTPKPPTPQAISRLLSAAGFERSDYGRPGVMWSAAATGYSVWKTCLQESPMTPVVAVQHIIKDSHFTTDDEEWRGYLRDIREALERYAESVRAAGFGAYVRDRRDEPAWLIVTAKED